MFEMSTTITLLQYIQLHTSSIGTNTCNLMKIIIFILNFLFLAQHVSTTSNSVILIGGFRGNQLNYKAENFRCPNSCTKNIWYDTEKLTNCPEEWLKVFKLYDSPITKTSSSIPGVKITAEPMGSLSSLRYIAAKPFRAYNTLYFNKIIKCLKSKGYKKGVTLFGAPRDWRKSPNEMEQYFNDLKKLIERQYRKTKNKVVLVGHSMGGIMSYIFLLKQTFEWKQKYIRAMIPLASRFGGGFSNWYGYLFDDDPPASPFTIERLAERTFPAYTFLMPNKITWNTTVMIETPSKNYTVADICEFFEKINIPKGCSMYLDSQVEAMKNMPHPQTSVYCIGALGIPTPLKLIYSDDNFESDPLKINGDGDGTINRESLEACLVWNNKGYEFNYKTFKKTNHLGLIRNDKPAKFICEVISEMD